MKKQHLFVLALAFTTSVTVACSQSPAPPTSPAGGNPSSADAGPDNSTLKIGSPTLVSPIGGVEISDRSPVLVINNVTPKFASSLPISYVFEVIDEDGSVVYTSPAIPAGANGQTAHEVNLNLDFNEAHTWRAWAVYQNQRGPRASVANFRLFSQYGVSCAHTGSEIGIVACRFEQHGNSPMDPEETIQFMKEVAFDLNQLGISDKGGFGVLIKTVGNNCLGYSCDIICEGNGGDQNQYDILIDERIPQWSEVDEVTVRQCEIIR